MSNFQFMEPSYRFTDTDASDIPTQPSGFPIFERGTLPAMARITRTEFGSRLVQARKSAKLTQEQLCTQIGIAQSTLSEAETVAIGSKHTAVLADALNVSPLWLATGQGPRTLNAPADMFAAPAQADAPAQEPSALARELTLLFDTLTDRIERACAYSKATQAILSVMQARDAPPTDAPAQSAPACRKTRQQ
jgi:transcriptional regulator with XRE-family HTH domain